MPLRASSTLTADHGTWPPWETTWARVAALGCLRLADRRDASGVDMQRRKPDATTDKHLPVLERANVSR
jgi:hypothetical protein